jgi:hypothetical protein
MPEHLDLLACIARNTVHRDQTLAQFGFRFRPGDKEAAGVAFLRAMKTDASREVAYNGAVAARLLDTPVRRVE